MNNVQLSAKERCCVYVDRTTKRVLGLAPEFGTPLFPPGSDIDCITCFTAKDIERWVKRFRDEQQRDREEATYRQVMREAPLRKAIREALIERNKHVDGVNRMLNDVMLEMMDRRYREAMERRNQVETFLPAEKWEAGVSGEDVAMENTDIRLN